MPITNYKIAKKVGARIRLIREKLGWSQASLAARLGTNYQSVSKVELGERGLTVASLYDYARALNVDVRELLP